MNIKEYLKNTLENKEILDLLADKRVYFLHAISPKPPYIEYEIINESGAFYVENEEKYTSYIVQVDIFSKGDYELIEDIVKKHMKNSKFNREMAADMFEKDTQLYHKAMRFNISLKVE